MSLNIESSIKPVATQATNNENVKEKNKSCSLISFITNLFLKIFSSPMNFCGQFHWTATYHKPAENNKKPDETSPLLQKDSKQEISSSDKAFANMIHKLREASSENDIHENEFKKIYSVFAKTLDIKTDHDEIIRTTEDGEKLARPLMKTTEGKVFILFTKHNSFDDDLVGKGSDNSIKYAYNLNENTVHAVGISKTFKVLEESRNQFLYPIKLMKELGENNVPKVEGCVVEENIKTHGTKRYTVMELYKGPLASQEGNTTTLAFQKLELKDSATEQMLKILADFEKKGIVHSDIKLQNFVYDLSMSKGIANVKVRAIDLDRSFGQTTKLRRRIGTVMFSAPEVLRNPKAQSNKADVYSMGLSLLQLWGYCDLPSIVSLYKSQLSKEHKTAILKIYSEVRGVDVTFIDDATANKIYLLALMLGIDQWFEPDSNDKLGVLLFRAVHPNPNMRPTAQEFLDEYQKINVSNLHYQKKRSAQALKSQTSPFTPEFSLKFDDIREAFKENLSSKK